jgi:hypothetical protein
MTTIAGVEIGPAHRCRIVAELSNSHNGSLENALRIIEEVKAAGADFMKFQCYTPDELVALRGDGSAPEPWGSEGWTMHKLYAKAQTPHAWFPALIAKCNELALPWFSSVFGKDSLRLVESLGCPAFKVAALDVGTKFARTVGAARKRGKVVIASSRGERIPWADLTLYCPEGYPQDWSTALGTPTACDGVSYHGTDVVMASWLAQSSHMLEVHVQLDDVPSELEANVSLTISQLRQLCAA